MRALISPVLALLLTSTAMHAASFDSQVDDFFLNAYFRFNPTAGTQAGLHQYDAELEDYSSGVMVTEQIAALRKYQAEFEKIDPAGLPQ